jgi:hypothetical protein
VPDHRKAERMLLLPQARYAEFAGIQIKRVAPAEMGWLRDGTDELQIKREVRMMLETVAGEPLHEKRDMPNVVTIHVDPAIDGNMVYSAKQVLKNRIGLRGPVLCLATLVLDLPEPVEAELDGSDTQFTKPHCNRLRQQCPVGNQKCVKFDIPGTGSPADPIQGRRHHLPVNQGLSPEKVQV